MLRLGSSQTAGAGLQRKFAYVLSALVGVLGVGTVGSIVILKLQPVQAFFYTVITISTVGSFTPESMSAERISAGGVALTIFLIFAGVGLLLYTFSTIMTFVVEGELTDILRRKRVQKEIDKLKDHYIVCGAGDTGRYVIEEFIRTKLPFVIIEIDKNRIQKLAPQERVLFIDGDATEDKTLVAAGVLRARGLVATLADDKDNLVLVLSARTLNPRLRIVSRVIEDACSYKLRRAGTNSAVSSNAIGGLRIASEMIRPVAVSFLDTMLRERAASYRVSEVEVNQSCSLAGRTLREARIPEKTGVLVIAIRGIDTGAFIYNPGADTKIKVGDTVIVISATNELKKLRALLAP